MKINRTVLGKNKIIRFLISFIFLLVLFNMVKINTVVAKESERVSISYYNDAGFYILDEKDTLTGGYAYDLEVALNRYLNWDVHYVYGVWKDCLESVKTGKTDIIFGVFKTPTRQRDYVFSKESIALVTNYICGRADEKFFNNDYTMVSGKRFGLINGATSSKQIKVFLNKKGIKVTYVMGASSKELRGLLADNKIDYFLTNTNVVNNSEKILQKFSVRPMYIMATKGKNNLMEEFDSAIKKMRLENPGLMKKILSRTYQHKAINISSLIDADERKFLKTAKTLNCGVIENSIPYYNLSKSGKAEGVIKVIVDQIDKNTGLKINLIPFKSEDDEIKAFQKGQINMFGMVSNDYYKSRVYNYNLSNSYLTSEVVILKNKNQKITKDLEYVYAIEKKSFDHEAELKSNMPNITFKKYKTGQECIDALNKHEVGAVIIGNFNARVYKRELEDTENLISYIANGVYLNHCFGFSERIDVKYLEIVDKVIMNLDSTNIKLSVINAINNPYDESMIGIFFDKYKYLIFIGIIGLLFLIILYTKTRKQNEALSRANKKANAATAAKSKFLANMSHELRTPLNAVIGLNYLLKSSLDNKEIAIDYVDKIDQSSKILLSTINDILDMSAIESGKLKVANAEFDLKEIVYSVINLYYIQCKEKGVKCESNVMDIEHEILIGDSYRIRQIILNLLSNAFKFTAKGGRIDLNFCERAIEDDKTLLYIEVNDTGCGMSEEFKKRLFNEFEQEDATTVRNYGGSGLGLTITKRLIDLMDGEIEVKSKLGEGTKFVVKIPLKFAEKNAVKINSEMMALDTLIVADNLITCKNVKDVFRKWKMKSECTISPDEAFKMIKQRVEANNEYNLYIIDMVLAEMNGIEFIKKLKEIITSKSAIMMIFSYDITEVKNIALNCERELFLRKPIFSSELFRLITNNLPTEKLLHKEHTTRNIALLEKMNVLLVEDNAINQLVAKRIIEQVGATVYIATNGLEALNLLRANKISYDIILMDIQMPVMDGYEATKLIRGIGTDYTDKLLIYAMTANSFQADIDKSFAVGMNGHISKPIEPKEIVELLFNAFEAKKK